MQKIWMAKTGWDEPIPANIMPHWETFIKGLAELAQIKTPRWIGENKKRLHLFCDASDDAYSVAAYIEVGDKDKTRLLCSKTRVAPDPKKSVYTPRLELLSNLLAARLGEYIEKALSTEFEKILWTDSAIALWWIKGEAGRWKQFVHNRVMEIRNRIPTESIRHCPGLQNPADIASRGASVRQLIDRPDWWEGLKWLANEIQWPKTPTKVDESCEEELQKEQKAVETTHCHTQATEKWYEKYSTLRRTVRVVAPIKRAMKKLRGEDDPDTPLAKIRCGGVTRKFSILSVEEIEEAELELWQTAQRDKFKEIIEAEEQGKPWKNS